MFGFKKRKALIKAYERELEELENQLEQANEVVSAARTLLVEWRDVLPTQQQQIANSIIADVDAATINGRSGSTELSAYFGLTRASWCVLPRVVMEAMPEAWKLRMADCLSEMSAAYPSWDEDCGDLFVQGRVKGKLSRIPEWLHNYRHPDKEALKRAEKADYELLL